jgi:hypothetical protein
VASFAAALLAVNINKTVLNTYIGLLVFLMGVVILMNRQFKFSWKKIIAIGLLSAFNKGISGGGFGPVVTGGQIMAGQEQKKAIAITLFSEIPICLVGFFTYLFVRAAKDQYREATIAGDQFGRQDAIRALLDRSRRDEALAMGDASAPLLNAWLGITPSGNSEWRAWNESFNFVQVPSPRRSGVVPIGTPGGDAWKPEVGTARCQPAYNSSHWSDVMRGRNSLSIVHKPDRISVEGHRPTANPARYAAPQCSCLVDDGTLHRDIQEIGLELHQQFIEDHAAIHFQRGQTHARICFHCFEHFARLVGAGFERRPGNVSLVDIARHADNRSARVTAPVGANRPEKAGTK